MRKINLLQVIPDFGLAGAEIMCENLVYYMQTTSLYDVTVCSLYNKHTAVTDRIEKRGIKVVYLGKKAGLDLGMIARLVKLMQNLKVDIVHTHRYAIQYAMPAAILAGVPIRIHTVHNVATKELNYSRRLLSKVLFNYFHVCPVSISPMVTDTIEKEYGIVKDDIPMVFNGIDLDHCLMKNSYGITNVFKFIHIGRMVHQKNHIMILHAAKRMKDEGRLFIINLIGEGDQESGLRELSIKLGLNDVVSFCGLTDNVYPFLQSSDCFILPSIYEGLPVTLVEAMGCGVPIIASNVGGIPDMIRNEENGVLIEPTVEELYAAMCKMMDSHPSYREKLGRNAKKRSELFSLQNMGAGYNMIYQNEVKQRLAK